MPAIDNIDIQAVFSRKDIGKPPCLYFKTQCMPFNTRCQIYLTSFLSLTKKAPAHAKTHHSPCGPPANSSATSIIYPPIVPKNAPITLLVHGGAWDIPDNAIEAHKNGVARALDAGYALLERG